MKRLIAALSLSPIMAGAVGVITITGAALFLPPAYFPEWHAPNDVETALDANFDWVDDVAVSEDIGAMCTAPDDAPADCVISFSDAGGALPANVTRTTSTLGGTPDAAASGTVTFGCTLTCDVGAPRTVNQAFTWTVESPDDTTPPDPPTNVQFASVDETTLEGSVSPCTDASGIQQYEFSSSGTEAICGSADNNLVQVAHPGTLQRDPCPAIINQLHVVVHITVKMLNRTILNYAQSIMHIHHSPHDY